MFQYDKNLEAKLLEKYFYSLFSQDPLLGQIGIQPDYHGGGVHYESEGKHLVTSLSEIKIEAKRSIADIINYDIEKFSENIYSLANQRLKHMYKIFAKTMEKITNLTGNITDAQGKPFSFDMILDSLEKVDIDFDDEGNARLPQILVGPDLGEKMKNLKMTESQEKRFAEIIEKKKKEFYDQKYYRRLSFID